MMQLYFFCYLCLNAMQIFTRQSLFFQLSSNGVYSFCFIYKTQILFPLRRREGRMAEGKKGLRDLNRSDRENADRRIDGISEKQKKRS